MRFTVPEHSVNAAKSARDHGFRRPERPNTQTWADNSWLRAKSGSIHAIGDPLMGLSRAEHSVNAAKSARGHGFRRPDRKSTRLNSSHVASSYAVFCLKKQKLLEAFPFIQEPPSGDL